MENNFKTYYEADGFTLHVQDKIWYTQCGVSKTFSLFELLKRTTDISTEDFRLRGMSRDRISEAGFARVVARSSFRIHRMPLRDEGIEIITAEEKPSALQIIQTYEFKAKDGSPLISGESEWMIIDEKTRRILPVKNFSLRTPNSVRKEHDCLPNGKIKRPENLNAAAEFKVRPSLLDGNGHVDNAWYATFVMDSLPAEFGEKIPKDFRINYSKELLLGDLLLVSSSVSEDGKKVTLIGEKKSSADDEKTELSFESELYF